LNSLELAHVVVEAIEDKLGASILLLDLQGISMVADYYVIATGGSDRHLKALARTVTELYGQKRNTGLRDLDDQATSGWVLLDLGEVIVHLFIGRQREHYGLEKLWSDGKVLLRVQ
jgi:ribosome-associated protein|tara:strand:+ start:379 stop:726 length:348 start_codon:yes stop_codon:yes gene_type:complete